MDGFYNTKNYCKSIRRRLTSSSVPPYHPIEVEESSRFHDRFLIIDETVYHIGASLKDLGKKLFAFSKMDVPVEWLEP